MQMEETLFLLIQVRTFAAKTAEKRERKEYEESTDVCEGCTTC